VRLGKNKLEFLEGSWVSLNWVGLGLVRLG
jgi:hypothetical protein